MKLQELVLESRAIAATSSRNAKAAALASLLRRLQPEEVPVAISFLSAETRQGRIGLGWAAVRDLAAAPLPVEASLTVAEVDAAFAAIAATRGSGSAAARSRLLGELFARATAEERDFLTRLILGELRQGALEGVLLEAIALAGGAPASEVRRAAMLAGELRPVAVAVLAAGPAGLERFRVQVLRPVLPMLAESAAGAGEALAALGEAALEAKLDGARIQAHKSGSEVRVFSRAMNDVTARVPEIVEALRALPESEVILDGEVLALRPDGRPWGFQTTMRRFGRRLDVETMRRELPLSACFFDCLLIGGEPTLDRPARERFAALGGMLPPQLIVPRLVTGDAARAEAFLAETLAQGHEGILAKSLDAAYEAGRRGASWLKVKPARTLDLVVLAVEWGSGRRKGWLSNLHLGARDPRTGGFVMVGKTFKGLTDELLAWQTQRFLELEVAREGPAVFVRPEQVVEIAFNDVQQSPRYPGGVALRFARVKRYRQDKTAAEADTIDQIRAFLPEAWRRQA